MCRLCAVIKNSSYGALMLDIICRHAGQGHVPEQMFDIGRLTFQIYDFEGFSDPRRGGDLNCTYLYR